MYNSNFNLTDEKKKPPFYIVQKMRIFDFLVCFEDLIKYDFRIYVNFMDLQEHWCGGTIRIQFIKLDTEFKSITP